MLVKRRVVVKTEAVSIVAVMFQAAMRCGVCPPEAIVHGPVEYIDGCGSMIVLGKIAHLMLGAGGRCVGLTPQRAWQRTAQ